MIRKKETNFKGTMKQFMRVVHKYNKLEETPMDFGSGDMLYRSEIHAIEAIGNEHDLNITVLARKLEITKATASELVSKLAKKGVIRKSKGDRNDKEVLLHLTERGKKAFQGHQEFQKQIYEDFVKTYKNVSLKQIESFENVLANIITNIDRYIHKKSVRN